MKIEMTYYPGFVMDVLAEEPCGGGEGDSDHRAFKVIDPEGEEDWVCEQMIRVVAD